MGIKLSPGVWSDLREVVGCTQQRLDLGMRSSMNNSMELRNEPEAAENNQGSSPRRVEDLRGRTELERADFDGQVGPDLNERGTILHY